MIHDLYAIFAVAYVVVLLSTSTLGESLRNKWNPGGVLFCPFCTSIWVSIPFTVMISLDSLWLRVPGIAAAANVVVLLIHMSMFTTEDKDEDILAMEKTE